VATRPTDAGTVRFGAIGVNHNYIYGMTDLPLEAGTQHVRVHGVAV
jgi:hypothetical protein